MCGIIGAFNRNAQPVDFGVLRRMSDSQRHRGPDDQGLLGFSIPEKRIAPMDQEADGFRSGFSGGLGFNRLSILDLSPNGHQPMISSTGDVAIAYNGETYNAFDLRDTLVRRGHSFHSQTDTEVLLHLYQEYGIDRMLELMNGMFAFCIVDVSLGRIFLARDHAGIKPMYWYRNGDTLLFASEVKAMLMHPSFHGAIDEGCLDEYLLYHYNGHDRTLFKGVNRVPPAHYLEISMEGEKLVEYWKPVLEDRVMLRGEAAIDQLDQVFRSSVESQLRSDVKLGCQLSGGIDSSMITTYAAERLGADMNAFSILFENQRYCESRYINQVLDRTGVTPHRYPLGPEYFSRNLVSAAWHMDEPLPLPQAVGFKRLAQGACNEVTVLLSGEGSDELMGGYQYLYHLAHRSRHPAVLYFLTSIRERGSKIARRFMMNEPMDRYLLMHREGDCLSHLMRFRPRMALDELLDQRRQMVPAQGDLLKRVRVYSMRTWLAHLLNIQDKMSMAHSIENRVPIIDRTMVDFVFSLPSDRFLRASRNPFNKNAPNRNTKMLLKKVAERYYGKDFAYRDKMGFNQPLADYFAHPEMREMIEDLILPGVARRGLIDPMWMRRTWEEICQGSHHPAMSLFWNCMTFELWAQLFIDRSLRV